MTTHRLPAQPAATTLSDRGRLPGPDVVRAVALIGVVVMNYHGYLILRGGPRGDGTLDRFFDPWSGPLATRFAATFVLTAGVGVTLLTRRAVGQPSLVTARRWTLIRRGLTLYGFGLLFDTIWPGTILPYYGAMFVLGAGLFTLRSRWVVATGLAAAVAGAGLAWWRLERQLDGQDTSWLFSPGGRGPRALLFNLFVNGTHPLFPWLAFFCAGIVIGRLLPTFWWRPAALASGFTMFGLAELISGAVRTGEHVALASTDPYDRGLLYTASALGSALIAFAAISWLAERFVHTMPVEVLRHAGAMTLTLYIAHGLAFNLVVDWLGWIEPGGLGRALTISAGYWALAITAAWWWHTRRGIGPAEWVYRHLGG
jgi:uncharacterized protein